MLTSAAPTRRAQAGGGPAPLGLVLLAGAIACAVPASGCASREARPGPEVQVARPLQRFDPAPIIAVRKVLIDGELRGYLKVKADESGDEELLLYLVYDEEFNQRGFQTESGQTYQLVGDRLVELGLRSRKGGVGELLTGSFESKVAFAAMDPPRTLASEAEDDAAAEAAD